MWLLPVLSLLSRATARTFYRMDVAGGAVPLSGPVLLVANHPNSLLDPVIVGAIAKRPVRFLAKSTLFSDRMVGWIVRGSGSIPVHRREDDPAVMGKNRDTFQTVYEILGTGAAVGIFPEGVSHSAPSMTTVRTGAARITLGCHEVTGRPPTIIPVGMVPDGKDRFRSLMKVVIGPPIRWDDLASSGPDDREAVRELTTRIESGLRRVTLNLEQEEDRAIVEGAEDIWRLHDGTDDTLLEPVARMAVATEILSSLRAHPGSPWDAERVALDRHLRRLRALGLVPSDLNADDRLRAALRWSLQRLFLFGTPFVVVAVLSMVVFWIPNWLTRLAVAHLDPPTDRQSTYKVTIGAPLHAIWILGVGLGVAMWVGWLGGVITVIVLAPLAVVGRRIREAWRAAWKDVRRFILIRSRWTLIEELRAEQERLGDRLDALHRAWTAGELS